MRRSGVVAAAIGISALLLTGCAAKPPWALTETLPKTPEFTQGLEFITINGEKMLGETTGLQGRSKVVLLDPDTPDEQVTSTPLPSAVFGEGLTQLPDGDILAGTWQHQTIFTLDQNLKIERTALAAFNVWGMCSTEDSLWVSDGTTNLTQRDIQTFEEISTVPLVDVEGEPLEDINEIDCLPEHNAILANQWKTDTMYAISLDDGSVLQTWDLSEISETPTDDTETEDVLNGIAIDPDDTDIVWVTGKNWDNFYVLELNYDFD